MLKQIKLSHESDSESLGDWHPLMHQLGTAEGLLSLSSATRTLQLPQVDSPESLREFLAAYQSEILVPLELPAICRAFLHASRNQTRELIAFDRELAGEPHLADFAAASRRVGRYQLKRLRPLRDIRLVQRYLKAVQDGTANGWHTLVYGLTLAIYSVPARQGLIIYERQTLRGFVYAAARSLELTESECRGMVDDLCADIDQTFEIALGEDCPEDFFRD